MTHYTSISTPRSTAGINAGLAVMASRGWKYINMCETSHSLNGVTIPWGARLTFEQDSDDIDDDTIAADVAAAEQAAESTK